MPISPSKARALCTAAEYELVKWSAPRSIKTLPPAKLKDKLDRARKLRDKYRGLAKKQSGEARGKRKPTGARAAKSNENTVMKAELFDQTLKRFETALTKADSKDSAAPKQDRKGAAGGKRTKAKSTKAKASESKGSGKPAKGKPQGAAPSATGVPISLSAPVHRPLSSTASLSSVSSGNPFSSVFSSSLTAQQSRETRRREKSQSTKIGREDSRFAATAREKIQGHVSAQTRRQQAKRDSKGS